MHLARATTQYGLALALTLIGVIGVVATHNQFIPCHGVEWTVPACLEAMDVAGHLGILQLFWLWALGLSAAGAAIANGRAARWVAASAVLVVLVFNYVTEYTIWLATYPQTADVPPGTGYSMAGAMILAGLLVTVSATLGLPRAGAEMSTYTRASTARVSETKRRLDARSSSSTARPSGPASGICQFGYSLSVPG